jgi:hypothetical protein
MFYLLFDWCVIFNQLQEARQRAAAFLADWSDEQAIMRKQATDER